MTIEMLIKLLRKAKKEHGNRDILVCGAGPGCYDWTFHEAVEVYPSAAPKGRKIHILLIGVSK